MTKRAPTYIERLDAALVPLIQFRAVLVTAIIDACTPTLDWLAWLLERFASHPGRTDRSVNETRREKTEPKEQP